MPNAKCQVPVRKAGESLLRMTHNSGEERTAKSEERSWLEGECERFPLIFRW